MVNPVAAWRLFYQPAYLSVATQWQSTLQHIGVHCHLEPLSIEPHHKWIKQQQLPCLFVDEYGLWLIASGLKVQPNWIGQVPRLRKATLKNELIARACALEPLCTVLDATAGLGHDSLILAWLGATVTLLERNPILYALLLSAHQQLRIYAQLQGYVRLQQVLDRMHLHFSSAEDYFLAHAQCRFDVVYLDPMFSQGDRVAQKQPQIKKEMQLLHIVLADDIDLGEHLLPLAMAHATRVVVKRPKLAACLNQQPAAHAWLGDACRFDAYFNVLPEVVSKQVIS